MPYHFKHNVNMHDGIFFINYAKDSNSGITDFDKKIIIFGNTPLKVRSWEPLWNVVIDGIASELEFSESKLASQFPDVTYDWNNFIKNEMFNISLEYNRSCKQVKYQKEIGEIWPGNPATFIHLYDMSLNIYDDYTYDDDYDTIMEHLTASLRQLKTSAGISQSNLTKLSINLDATEPTLDSILERLVEMKKQSIPLRMGYFKENDGSFGALINKEYAFQLELLEKHFRSCYIEDSELIIETVKKQLETYGTYK